MPAILHRVAVDVFDEPVNAKRLAAYLAEPGHLRLSRSQATRWWLNARRSSTDPDKPTELYIDEVGVAPTFQRQGIARQLLDEMFALGKALGCEEAWVGTELDNRHVAFMRPVEQRQSRS